MLDTSAQIQICCIPKKIDIEYSNIKITYSRSQNTGIIPNINNEIFTVFNVPACLFNSPLKAHKMNVISSDLYLFRCMITYVYVYKQPNTLNMTASQKPHSQLP